MSKKIQIDYPCSQKDLYSALETAWGNNATHLADFTQVKPLYTMPYNAAARAAIVAARAMPDDAARTGASKMFHINLVKAGKVCLQNFQFLKSYIDTAYTDKEEQKTQYIVAGQNYYKDAANEDWESMVMLNTSANNYLGIADNVTALTDNNNMPPTFVATLKTAGDGFELLYNDFKLAEETSVETANKIKANNACYQTGIQMMKDAQVIFMNEPDVLTKFVFGNLLALINPPVAGIKGTVKEAVSFEPVVNVMMVVQKDGEPSENVVVDVNGDFGMQLAEGHYNIKVGAPGYVDQLFEMDLKLSGLKTLNVVLVKEV